MLIPAAPACPDDEELRRFFAASPDAFFRLNADWRCLHQLFGKALLVDTLQPTSTWLDIYVPPPQQPQLRRWIAQAVHTQDVFDHVLQANFANGAVGWVHARAVPVRNAHGDVTEWLGTAARTGPPAPVAGPVAPAHALFVAVQEAEEAERKRIAEGLHNGIGQMLYAVKLRLERSRELVPTADAAANALRRETDELLADAIRQVRALSHELVPMVLEQFGLPTALQNLCRKMSSGPLHLHCAVHIDHTLPALPGALQVALYRIAQELTQNIVKHAAGATRASIEVENVTGFVLLRAEDDGPGFAASTTAKGGLGLRSIRDRVALLGGEMETSPLNRPGAYVRVRLPIPLPVRPSA